MECKEKIEENQEMQENAQVVEVVDYKDKYVRLLADMDNLRKHTSKQIENATISANEKMIKEILPFLDSLDYAIDIDDESHRQNHNRVLRKQILDILAKFGLEEIKIEPLETLFNDEVMNAVMLEPTPREELHHFVYKILKKGYTLNGVVIRHANVIVLSHSK